MKQNRKNQETRDSYSLRAVKGEGNERKFILSFSSEEPYSRYWGSEILEHSEGALELSRISEIGCVLFNHNRDMPIGKINRVWVENNRGNAEIEMDTDAKSEEIFQKIKNGTLKGVSVGYRVDVWEEVMPNKKSSDGRFDGPVSIAKRWTPFEISIVTVPADPTVGVGRELEEETESKLQFIRSLSFYEWQLKINQNRRQV